MCESAVNLDLTYSEAICLINAFKKHPTLWNPHVFNYHNRESKEEAWKLVAVETTIPTETCKRKMKSLLSSCRRVKVKILQSRNTGDPKDVIQPTWRYWNAFRFLRGLGDGDEDPLGTAPEMDILEPSVKAKLKNNPTIVPSPELVLADENVEEEPFGEIVAAKLRKMYPDQRLYAENLIHQCLYKGMLTQLTSKSKVRTPEFDRLQKNNTTPSLLEDPLKIDSIGIVSQNNSNDIEEEDSSLADSDEFPHLTML